MKFQQMFYTNMRTLEKKRKLINLMIALKFSLSLLFIDGEVLLEPETANKRYTFELKYFRQNQWHRLSFYQC